MNEFCLKVVNITNETLSSVVITIGIEDNLKNKFKFIPGQYITVGINDENEKKIHRCYSICSSTSNKNISFCVKKINNGIVSTYLSEQLKTGDYIYITPPTGNFRLKTNKHQRGTIFIAGGSGITPVKSMIMSLIEKKTKGYITLIYGNTDIDNIIFKTFLKSIENNKEINIIHTLDNYNDRWDGEIGQLTENNLNYLITKYKIDVLNSDTYICAPEAVIKNSIKLLKKLNVPDKSIHFERFFSAKKPIEPNKTLSTPIDSVIVIDNIKHKINIKPGQNILDAVIENGHHVNYSCKSGICSTCIAKKIDGELFIIEDEGLSLEQRKNDFVLTCQSYPLNNSVEINYDINDNTISSRRKISLSIGGLISMLLILFYIQPSNETYIAKGAYNTGHESLSCIQCHQSSPGTTRQQLQVNVKHLLGLSDHKVIFGKKTVDNNKCINCHNKPNDRHPVHRFMEPRFEEARKLIQPEKCISCHMEHEGKRVTIQKMNFCINCHQDTKLVNDPLDTSHEELINNGHWNSCIQCHDFHGNHIMKTPNVMKDTIPINSLKVYFEGGEDPYSEIKKYLSKQN